MDAAILQKAKNWLSDDFDEETRKEIQDLLDRNDEKELTDRFYTDLEFGTAGLRGTLGAGDNRMNIYNVRKATQGLANYILAKGGQRKGVLIGRDSRNMSDVFAMETASVFIANGIKVYYFEDIHPTPTVSFGLRHLGAISGVMITASHNPKEYNGYKVLWEDGSQITPPYDSEIISEVRNITSLKQVKTVPFDIARNTDLFEIVDKKVDPVYLNKVLSLSIHPDCIPGSGVRICYSPLYGTGYRLVPESLKKYGFHDIVIVEEQAHPDGNFPTAPFPNPEETETMAPGMKVAQDHGADVFIATDPDADRIGAMLKKSNGDYVLLNGNQIATLFGYYIASELRATGKMPKNPRLVTTIVTTGLLLDIAETFGVKADEVLTGFKWIGNRMFYYEKEGLDFIFGCEESHGFLVGTFVRDKDAVIASSLFAELTAYYKTKGTSAFKVLQDIYRKYGYYKESQKSVTMKGQDGAKQIIALMNNLRNKTPKTIGKYKVLSIADLMNGDEKDIQSGKVIKKWDLPSSDVVVLKLSDNAKIIGRPSGTEPKIKFYFTTSGKLSAGEELGYLMKRVDSEHIELKESFMKLIETNG